MALFTEYYLDTSPYKRALDDANRRLLSHRGSVQTEMQKVRAAFAEAAKEGGAAGKAQGEAITKVIKSIERVSKSAEKEIKHLQNLNKIGLISDKDLKSQVGKLRSSVSAAVADITRSSQRVGPTLSKHLSAALGRVGATAEAAGKKGSVLSNLFEKAGTRIKQAMAGIAAAGVLALVAATNKAIQAAAKFNFEFAQTKTLVDLSAFRFAHLRDGLLRISDTVPVSIGALTGALYQTISAGIDAADALGVLDVAARAAVGGGTSVKTAVDGMTTALNAFGIASSQSEAVADSFFTAVARGKTTFGELSSSIGRVAPMANQMNLSLDETLAAIAALTLGGLSTNESVTRLNAALSAFLRNSDKIAAAGIDVQAVLDDRGLLGVMRDLHEVTGGNSKALQELVGDTEGLTAVLALGGTQAESFVSILDDMKDKAGATSRAFTTMKTETINLWNQVKNNLLTAAIELGQKALPTVNRALQAILETFESFRSPTEQLINQLKAIDGIDPELVARLEATHALDQARTLADQLKRELESTEVIVGFELTPVYAGVNAAAFKEVKASAVDLEFLEGKIQDVGAALQDLAAEEIKAEKQGRTLDVDHGTRVTALRQQYQSLIEALRLVTAYQDAQQVAAQSADAFMPSTTGSTTPPTPEETPVVASLQREIDALEKQKAKLVDLGASLDAAGKAELEAIKQKLAELLALRKKLAELPDPKKDERETKKADKAAEQAAKKEQAESRRLAIAAARVGLEKEEADVAQNILQTQHQLEDREKRLAQLKAEQAGSNTDSADKRSAHLKQLIANDRFRLTQLKAQQETLEAQRRIYDELPDDIEKIIDQVADVDAAIASGLTDQDARRLTDFVQNANQIVEEAKAQLLPLLVKLEADPNNTELQDDVQRLSDAATRRLGEALSAALAQMEADTGTTTAAYQLLLQVMQALTGEVESLAGATESVAQGATSAAERLEGLSTTIRTALNLADALGLVSEELLTIGRGAIDAIDNLAALNKLRDAARASGGGGGGSLLGTVTGSLAGLSAGLGVVGGIATAATGLIGALRRRSQAEKERAREQAETLRRQQEEMQRLQEALRDNARDIRQGIRDLLNAPRVAENTTGIAAQQALGLLYQTESDLTGGSPPSPETNEFRVRSAISELTMLGDTAELERLFSQYLQEGLDAESSFNAALSASGFVNLLEALLRPEADRIISSALDEIQPPEPRPVDADTFFNDLLDLDLADLDVDAFQAQYDQLVESGLSANEALQQVLDEGLREAIEAIANRLGGFGASIEGAVAKLDFFQTYMSAQGVAALNQFLGDVLGTTEGLSDELRDQLEALQDDPTLIAETIAAIAEAATEEGDAAFFGGLTPGQIDLLLETLQGLEADITRPESATAGDSRDSSIFRGVTEVQARESNAYLELIAHWQEVAATGIGDMVELLSAYLTYLLADTELQYPTGPAGPSTTDSIGDRSGDRFGDSSGGDAGGSGDGFDLHHLGGVAGGAGPMGAGPTTDIQRRLAQTVARINAHGLALQRRAERRPAPPATGRQDRDVGVSIGQIGPFEQSRDEDALVRHILGRIDPHLRQAIRAALRRSG